MLWPYQNVTPNIAVFEGVCQQQGDILIDWVGILPYEMIQDGDRYTPHQTGKIGQQSLPLRPSTCGEQ